LMIMENISTIAILVVLATITLPLAAVGLTLWLGGMNPADEADTSEGA
ncbi:MAG: hypothetical protein ACI8RZ_001752, partial [Myxococcota bacterium]